MGTSFLFFGLWRIDVHYYKEKLRIKDEVLEFEKRMREILFRRQIKMARGDRFYYGIDTSLLDNQWLKYFIKWYLEGANKELFEKFGTLSDDYNFAMDNYLKRDDVQRCIADYTKRNKDMNFVKLYNKMLDKALDGDTKSADWILKAQDNEFFKVKSKSAIDNIIEGLDINE